MSRESKNRRRRARPRDGKAVDPLTTPSQPPFPATGHDAIFDDFFVVRSAVPRPPRRR